MEMSFQKKNNEVGGEPPPALNNMLYEDNSLMTYEDNTPMGYQ
jgi:hypothetical protein